MSGATQASVQRTQKSAPTSEPANAPQHVPNVSAAGDGNAQVSATRSGRSVDASTSADAAASASVQR
jgi:hypothetical protein